MKFGFLKVSMIAIRTVRRFLFLLLVAFQLQVGLAQDGNPFLTHYKLPDGISNQNWDFVQGDNGLMYILNRKGIFSFDGLQWENLKVMGRPIALAYSNDLFYCTDRGVGYMDISPEGQFQEHLLIQSTDENYFYKFCHLSDGLLVVSPTTICKITTQPQIKVDTIHFDDRPQVFISDLFELEGGVYHIQNRALICLNKPDGGYEIVAGLPIGFDMTFSFVHSENAYFGATDNKLYRFDGDRLTPFSFDDQDYIVASVPTGGVSVDDKTFALATLNGGSVLVNSNDGTTAYTLNYVSGLPDDEIYSLGRDSDKGLWLSHGMGISRADLNVPVKSYSYYQGLRGNVLSAAMYNSKLYVGTSEGLFYLDEKRDYKAISVPIRRKVKPAVAQPDPEPAPTAPEPETIEKKKRGFLSRLFSRGSDRPENIEVQSSGQYVDAPVQEAKDLPPQRRTIYQLQSVTHHYDQVQAVKGKVKQLLPYNGKLYVLSNLGLFEVDDGKVNHIVRDLNLTFVEPLPDSPNSFVLGADGGAYLAAKSRGEWILLPLVEGYNGQIVSAIKFDNQRFLLSSEFDVLLVTQQQVNNYELTKIAIPGTQYSNPIVRWHKEKPYAFSSSGAYLFDASMNTLMLDDDFPIHEISTIIFNQSDYTWFKHDGIWDIPSSVTAELQATKNYLNLLENPQYIHYQSDSCLIVVDDFRHVYKINLSNQGPRDNDLGIFFKSIKDREGSLLGYSNVELTYSNNALSVRVSAPSYVKEGAVSFQYQIKGLMDGWTQWSSDPSMDFPFLPPGRYTVLVRAKDVLGIVSPTLDFSILIKPPFWQTVWFFVLCGVCVLVLFLIIVKVRERSLKRDKEMLEQKVRERTRTIEEQKETLKKQRDNLEVYNQEILSQKEEIEAQRDEIELQRDQIYKQNDEITQSIAYARKIQSAVMPSKEIVSCILPNYFIVFRPRDIVSGDFYWIGEKDNKIVIVAADCTGHGVPGAFMSMIGVSFINDIVNVEGIVSSSQILENLRQKIITTLWQTGKDGEARDGMDMAVCVYSKDLSQVEYSGAYNPLYIIRKGELIEYKADKMPVGVHPKQDIGFTSHTIDLLPGDNLYIFSDGFVDQFGGPDGRKFMTKPFKHLLASLDGLPPDEQKQVLEDTLDGWQGAFDQIDDVLIVGVIVP